MATAEAVHRRRPAREVVSEADKLHLVMVVADEVARRYRIDDPCELWGDGWLGVRVAEAAWRRECPLIYYMRERVRGAILDSLKKSRIVVVNIAM